jgi:hypothetical protein
MKAKPRHSMLRARARLALARVLLSAQRSKLLIILISILTHLLTFYCLRSYADKKQYFDLQASLSKEANVVAVASARSLLDNAARVCSTAMEGAYECLQAKQLDGKIAASARDESLRFAAESEGWLSQANHLLHNGMSTEQYLELEGAIGVVERERGGSTMTAEYGNLSKVRAAQQRARKTRLNEVSALTNLAKATAGDGVSSGNSGRRARCSDEGVEVVTAPVNWPFGTPERTKKMVSRVRTRSMMRMGDTTLNKSDRTKACVVRTGLANNDETYVSIVNNMVVSGMPASQDVLNVCLTQASLEMHMKNNK